MATALVGSGVFLLPASLAAFGSASLLAWVLTSTGALLLALVFARLGRAYPKTGDREPRAPLCWRRREGQAAGGRPARHG